MDVSIVIVSWQVKEQLKNCLTSIYKETKNLEFEVFVIDNNSSDSTVEMVLNNFSKVHLIANKSNLGFAKACNQGIQRSKGKKVLILNPDTEIRDNAVKKIYNFMSNNPDCGIAGCKIKNEDGSVQPSVRRFPDILSHILILLKLHNFFPSFKPLGKYHFNDFDYNTTQIVDQVMGAFYMLNRDMLKKVGIFDEHFYIWYEEVDLCKRAIEKGWKTYYIHEATVMHLKGVSFGKANVIKKQIIFNRSLLYYFFKHKNIVSYFILLIIYPISISLSFLVQIVGYKKIRKDI
ncbi:MAG: glycosyltransferase family 2 protein [Candidatus Kerfeldbacteria bacterium]